MLLPHFVSRLLPQPELQDREHPGLICIQSNVLLSSCSVLTHIENVIRDSPSTYYHPKFPCAFTDTLQAFTLFLGNRVEVNFNMLKFERLA